MIISGSLYALVAITCIKVGNEVSKWVDKHTMSIEMIRIKNK